MTGRRDSLERIAAALERLAPDVRPSHDWTSAPAYLWEGEQARPIEALAALPLGQLRGIDRQKETLRANVARIASGAAAHDTLLWGARGMGKSALLRSAVADVQKEAGSRLALVQIAPGALDTVPALLSELAEHERSFLLFIDDLGFGTDHQAETLALRSLLDGGIVPRPPRVRVAVTSNRRAIVARDASEADALHERDARDDALALADRFGLTVAFHPCDRKTYLEILRAYTDPLDLTVDEEEAMAWAIARGNRSGRTALQFATELAGRAGLAL
jgi:predicted AAA+ superfamily ATPase